MPLNLENTVAEPAKTEDDAAAVESDKDEDLLPDDNRAARLNAIVGTATFLCNADPNYKEQMVEIVKKEFYEFSGYVSTPSNIITTIMLCYHLN